MQKIYIIIAEKHNYINNKIDLFFLGSFCEKENANKVIDKYRYLTLSNLNNMCFLSIKNENDLTTYNENSCTEYFNHETNQGFKVYIQEVNFQSINLLGFNETIKFCNNGKEE